MPSYTYRAGELVEVPDIIVSESCEIREPVKNTVIIRSGAQVTARSTLSGTVTVEQGAVLEAHGPVNGTVTIEGGARAVFHDRASGTIHVRAGGEARLTPTAVALGTMTVDGVLTNEGVRGVQVKGSGEVIDAPGSMVREPDETLTYGTVVYRS